MYQDVVNGILEAVREEPVLKVILDYEPQSLQDAPAFYLTLDGFQRQVHGNVTAMRYRINGRLAIRWQDNETAEQELAYLVNRVPYLIELDQTLGMKHCIVSVTDGDAGYREIGGVVYRVVDIKIDALEKGAEGV